MGNEEPMNRQFFRGESIIHLYAKDAGDRDGVSYRETCWFQQTAGGAYKNGYDHNTRIMNNENRLENG